jgi:hypothetical protein
MTAHRSETVLVIAGGPSVAGVDLKALPDSVLIIGVNDAALRAPRVDMAVTMDRLWTEARYAELRARALPAFIRTAALQNISAPYYEHCHPFDCDHTSSVMSPNLHTLNGTNSGACALNLAYIGHPRRVFLYGFDMARGVRSTPYWYAPYPWRPKGGTGEGTYKQWAGQFDIPAAQFRDAGIEVFNVSPHSAIKSFPKLNQHEALAMLRT